MKKRIFLVIAMIAMLACILAVSISAVDPAYADGEWIYADDDTTKLAIRDIEGNPLIWYMNGTQLKYVRADQTDSTQSVYVSYKIEAGGKGFSGVAPQKTLMDIDVYDNGTQIECSGINSALVLINLEKLDIDALNGWLWGNKNGCCTKMRGIVFPSTLKYMGQEGLTNTKLVQIWNLENTQLEYINACNFAATSTLTQEATNGVFKCPQTIMQPIEVQKSQIVTYIMNPYFEWAQLNQQWNQYFRECKQLQKLVCPAQVRIGFGNEAFRETPTQYIVFLTGTQTDAQNLLANTNSSYNTGFKSAQIISYETYMSNQEKYDNSTNQVYIVYGYSFCDGFYDGVHNDIGNSCVINCDRCDEYDGNMKANPQHKYEETITYKNYLQSGVKVQTCQNEGCEHNKTPNNVNVDAIIAAFKGFSIKEEGTGLTFGYTLNHDATISELLNPVNRIHNLLDRINNEQK